MSRQLRRSRVQRRSTHRVKRSGVQLESLESRQLMHGEGVLDQVNQVPPILAAPADICIDFEDLKLSSTYHVGDTFVADDSGFQAAITGEPFTWSNGVTTAAGEATINNGNLAAHLGQEVGINNILLNFKFDRTPTGLVMRFGEYGGNLNVEINGDFRNIDNFQDIDGQVIGGTLVQIPSGGSGNDHGAMVVTGDIHSFKIGGQELWIDHVCVRDLPQAIYDFGDAPDQPYPTLNANAGAKHLVDPKVHLGKLIEAEPDGQPTPLSNGDDQTLGAEIDDEDGVRFLTPLVPGTEAKVEVTASVDGWLNAWLDFNRNGQWQSGTDEHLFSGTPISAGVNVLSFMVPAATITSNERPAFSRWRFSTTDRFLKPETSSRDIPNGEVEDHAVRIPDVQRDDFDWGDAPDQPYPTLAASGGAFHKIDPKVHLGERIEGEADGQPSLASDGDDQVAGVKVDDEDGVRFLSPLVPGQFAKVEVIASVDGWLNAWIDFDRNGDWTSGPADRIFTAEPLSAGVNILSFLVPADAKPEPNRPTYSRWRFSTTDRVLRPTQPRDNIPNGEVEDHLAFIQEGQPEARLDWGDAPDGPYRTLKVHGGAVHEIDPKVYLGNGVDPEADGQPTPGATGDDVGGADDEDGIEFAGPLVRGQVNQVKVTASVDGWLNAWIDFNQNGSWEPGTAEAIFVSQPVAAGVNMLNFFVPAAAAQNGEIVHSRWRFSTTHKVLLPFLSSPEGKMPNGEVEDHVLKITNPDPDKLDWGDAPDGPYRTLSVHGGAVHKIDPKVYLGHGVDPEVDGQPTPNASGDDSSGADDEDGIDFAGPLVRGQINQVQVTASVNGWLNAWIDFNQNGSWEPGTAEAIFVSQPVVAGVNLLSFFVPAAAAANGEVVHSRWRFSTTHNALMPFLGSPDGTMPNGEVEDHLLKITDPDPQGRFDFGDAPDPSYPTRLANDGARHAIDRKVYLGTQIDPELDGQGTFTALGDDANGVDDEDGVKFLTPVLPGSDAKVEVLASTEGKLDAWLDFNQDGQWDASETIAASIPMAAGFNTFGFFVPAGSLPSINKPTYARFRFSTDGGLTPKGVAKNGEVEDYMILNGDQDHDGVVSPADADLLCRAIHAGNDRGDLNGDGLVNEADMDYLIKTIMGTFYGDANWDGRFDSADLVKVFAGGEYEDNIPNNSGWGDGDWDCDGDFTSGDLIKAFQDGGYEQPEAASPASDPIDALLALEGDEAVRRKSVAALDELFASL